MFSFKHAARFLVASAVLAALPLSSAHADLIEYSFTGADGLNRTLGAGAVYANPVSDMRFALSAGVDRKVRISIIQDGQPISTATSKLLGGGDRIVAGGQEYYGAVLALKAPGEGQYKLKAEILGSDDSVVKVDTHALIVDTTAPSTQEQIIWVARVAGGGSIDIFTSSGTGNEIRLDGLADSSSGLDSAVYYTRDINGIEREVVVPIASTGSVYLPVATAAGPTLAPIDQSTYTIGFKVKDRAGNVADIHRHSKIDRVTPPVTVEAYDSQAKIWKPYKAGMTVHDNPVKVRWIRQKTDHVAFNNTDFGWHDSTYDETTTTQLIHNAAVLYPTTASGFRLYTKAGRYYDQQYRNLQFTLSDAADKAPVVSGLKFQLSNGHTTANELVGEVAYLRFKDELRGTTLTRAIFNVEPRPYVQKIVLNATGLGSCEVPANGTSCFVNMSISEGAGGNYRDITYDSMKADGTWRARSGRMRIIWDVEPPIVENVSVDIADKSFTAKIYDQNRLNNSMRDEWDTLDLVAQAVGTQTYSLPLISLTETDYSRRTGVYDFSNLPSGTYTFRMTATDTYGNPAVRSSSARLVDNDLPIASIRHVNGGALSSISTLDDIAIHLADATDPEPSVVSVELRGGPANDNVRVSARPIGNGQFRIEYPIIFPSLAAGEEYALEVIARDAQGNTSSTVSTFSYVPPNIPLDGNLTIPAAPFVFTTLTGESVIRTQPLLLGSGEAVSGTYDVFATLRSDAPGALYVGGKLLAPGATVTVSSMNFSATGGRIVLSARPADAGATGDYGLLISTSAPNSPVVVGSIAAWMPQTTLTRTTDNPDQVITEQTIALAPSSASRCPITTDSQLARASDPLVAPVCLLEWTKIPQGLKEVAIEGEHPMTQLHGTYQASGVQTAAYEISLFAADGTKRLLKRGTDTVNVKPPFESATFKHSLENATLQRSVDTANLQFIQTSSPACEITSSYVKARDAAANGGPLTCLIEVNEKPADLHQVDAGMPEYAGIIQSAGAHPLAWTVSIYSAFGEKLLLQQATSTIRVVEPPVETRLAMRVEEGRSTTGTPEETFPQAWTKKTYQVTQEPARGRVEANATGFHYVAESGFVGADTFGYRVLDESGMYADGEAIVEVMPFNYPPSVEPLKLVADRAAPSRFLLSAQDPNNWDIHSFEIVSGPVPAGIKASIEGNELILEPINYWHGDLQLHYHAIDLAGAVSEPAVIQVHVPLGNAAPVARNAEVVAQQGQSVIVRLSATDADSPAPTVFEIVKGSPNLDARITGSHISVTPKANFIGLAELAFRAQDDGGLWSAPALLLVEVVEAPPAQDDEDQGPREPTQNGSMLVKFKIRGMR